MDSSAGMSSSPSADDFTSPPQLAPHSSAVNAHALPLGHIMKRIAHAFHHYNHTCTSGAVTALHFAASQHRAMTC